MGGDSLLLLVLLFIGLLFAPVETRTLKLLDHIGKIPTTVAPTVPYSTEWTTRLGEISEESTTVPSNTTDHTTKIEQHLVALTNEGTGDEIIDLLQTSDNETMPLDEYNGWTNSTEGLPTTEWTVPEGMIRQCRCTEVVECKARAGQETENCFENCDERLSFLGNDTHSYIDCFEKNTDGITHAESCLETFLGSYCSTSLTPQYIEAREHEDFVNTKFILNKEPKKHRPLLHKTHHILAGFHEFYHCSKHCVHKRMLECFREKSCSIRLPSLPSFGEAMSNCAKKNVKVARSLRSTCQCLLHKKKLKQLVGSCAVMTPMKVKEI